MKNIARHIISFMLPVTVLLVVPWLIGDDARIEPGFLFWSGLVFITAGLSLLVSTIILFATIGSGTLAPWFPTGKLVVAGPYRYVRNPMILGVLTILLGESALFQSRAILIWTCLFFVINHLFFLLYEEPSLERRFGEDYLKYKSGVRRWLPAIKPWKPSG